MRVCTSERRTKRVSKSAFFGMRHLAKGITRHDSVPSLAVLLVWAGDVRNRQSLGVPWPESRLEGGDLFRFLGISGPFPRQRENFRLPWLPGLGLMKKVDPFIPWWLENGVKGFTISFHLPQSTTKVTYSGSTGDHAMVPYSRAQHYPQPSTSRPQMQAN